MGPGCDIVCRIKQELVRAGQGYWRPGGPGRARASALGQRRCRRVSARVFCVRSRSPPGPHCAGFGKGFRGCARQVHVAHLLHGRQQLRLLRALQARLLRGQVRQTLAALALQTLAQLQALEGLQGRRLLQACQTLQGLRLLRRRRAERRLLLQALQALQALLLLRRRRAERRLLLQALLLL